MSASGRPVRLLYIGGFDFPAPHARAIQTLRTAHALAAAGWEVGGHTIDHVDLAAVDPGVAFAQVRECRARLEDVVESPVRTFAYPYGRVSGAAVEAVEAAGFTLAVTTRPGALDVRRPLRLDRFMLSPRTGPAGVRACFGPALPAVERAVGRYARVLPGTDCTRFLPPHEIHGFRGGPGGGEEAA
jgi:peptidoglycan/xylan/chitin deacetylase (PgdA/CDA1 family)